MANDYKDFLDELTLSYESSTHEVFPDTEIFWFEENNSLFIRGSDSIVDWFFNLLSVPDPYSGIHLGFSIKASFLNEFLRKNNLHPKLVVGHSLGGAIAQLVGFEFDSEVYSLACPRTIVNRKNKHIGQFISWADKKLCIINQENDIISKLPPWGSHPIEPLWLDSYDYGVFAHDLIAFE